GEEVTLKNTDGKVRLVYFFFASCPDVCLPTTHMISKVQEGLKEEGVLGSEARIISITFDPVIDTTENLKAFAALNKADTKSWDFLRGDEEYSKELAEKYKVQVIKDKEGDFLHSNRIVLIDGKRNIRKAYSGNDLDLEYETILQDMVALSKE
ncbi:MAG TPA: SCO family protein, partial [Bacilli bacterium]